MSCRREKEDMSTIEDTIAAALAPYAGRLPSEATGVIRDVTSALTTRENGMADELRAIAEQQGVRVSAVDQALRTIEMGTPLHSVHDSSGNGALRTMNIDGPTVVLIGNPVEGVTCVGPFDTADRALDYANIHLTNEDCWLMAISSPAR